MFLSSSSSSLSESSSLFFSFFILSKDTGCRQSWCLNCSGKKYIMSGTPKTVAWLDFLMLWEFQYSLTLSRSVCSWSAKQNHNAYLCISLVRSRISDSLRSWRKSNKQYHNQIKSTLFNLES